VVVEAKVVKEAREAKVVKVVKEAKEAKEAKVVVVVEIFHQMVQMFLVFQITILPEVIHPVGIQRTGLIDVFQEELSLETPKIQVSL
jgi:hypothetical protein